MVFGKVLSKLMKVELGSWKTENLFNMYANEISLLSIPLKEALGQVKLKSPCFTTGFNTTVYTYHKQLHTKALHIGIIRCYMVSPHA